MGGSPSSTVENRALKDDSITLNYDNISSQRSALRDAGYIFQVAHYYHKMAEIASPRHPTSAEPSGNRSYSKWINTTHSTVVLLPDGPTVMRWQGPTSPVHPISTHSSLKLSIHTRIDFYLVYDLFSLFFPH